MSLSVLSQRESVALVSQDRNHVVACPVVAPKPCTFITNAFPSLSSRSATFTK